MRTKGWKDVFKFTFIQQVKTKSFIISTIVIALILGIMAALANILPAVILGNEINKIESSANENKLTISKLYIYNETDIAFDFSEMLTALGITCENCADANAANSIIKTLEESSENAMLTWIKKTESSFAVNSRYAGANSEVTSADAKVVTSNISAMVKTQYYTDKLGIPEEELTYVMSNVAEDVSVAGKAPVSMVQDIINTIVPMFSSIILFIFIFSYSQLVAQSVAIEKSSRIMEYLLTSIKPLAIIIGKVLAMCLVSLMQFIFIGFGGTAGFLISMPFGIFSKIDTLVSAAGQTGEAANVQDILVDLQGAFSTFNIGSIFIMLITFILGFLFFSLLAGLAGASISKMEDLSAAIQPMSLVGVLGFYLAYFPQIGAMEGDENVMMVVARFLPISSPFILPSDYMLGKIDIGMTMVSILVLLAAVVIMAMIVAKVYEHIVLHTGNRLTLSEMFKMSK